MSQQAVTEFMLMDSSVASAESFIQVCVRKRLTEISTGIKLNILTDSSVHIQASNLEDCIINL